jgi:hypothetical protein
MGRRVHPNSPVGRLCDWSKTGIPHPDSPAGRNFDWSAIGLPHPNSPAGRWSTQSQISIANQIRQFATQQDLDDFRRDPVIVMPCLPDPDEDEIQTMATPNDMRNRLGS